MKKIGFLLTLAVCLNACTQAQQPTDPFDAMEKQMQQMMRDMRSGKAFTMPKGMDSTYTFKFDTTFGNGNSHFFFHIDPPTGNGQDPWGQDGDAMMNQMMQQLRNFSQQFGQGQFDEGQRLDPQDMPPADDGGIRKEGDLLPEEQLRKEDANPKAKTPAPEPAKPEEKKSKIKTVRI
jgi:hypothetical protein